MEVAPDGWVVVVDPAFCVVLVVGPLVVVVDPPWVVVVVTGRDDVVVDVDLGASVVVVVVGGRVVDVVVVGSKTEPPEFPDDPEFVALAAGG